MSLFQRKNFTALKTACAQVLQHDCKIDRGATTSAAALKRTRYYQFRISLAGCAALYIHTLAPGLLFYDVARKTSAIKKPISRVGQNPAEREPLKTSARSFTQCRAYTAEAAAFNVGEIQYPLPRLYSRTHKSELL